MDKKKSEPPEYPKIHYTRRGERFVDDEDFLMSKTGQRSLKSAIELEKFIIANAKSDAKSDSRK